MGARRSSQQFFAASESDAATDSTPPGLGGFMHGFYWYAHVVALTQEHVRWLHISVLELLATGFSTIIFTPLLPPGAKRLTHGADATATVTTLTRETESSEMLMLTHHALLQCDQFKALAPRADLGHLRGDSNLGADAVSASRVRCGIPSLAGDERHG